MRTSRNASSMLSGVSSATPVSRALALRKPLEMVSNMLIPRRRYGGGPGQRVARGKRGVLSRRAPADKMAAAPGFGQGMYPMRIAVVLLLCPAAVAAAPAPQGTSPPARPAAPGGAGPVEIPCERVEPGVI